MNLFQIEHPISKQLLTVSEAEYNDFVKLPLPQKAQYWKMTKELRDVSPTEGKVTVPEVSSSALAIQVDGTHYKDMPIQPVQYNHANKLPFIEGSVVKYVSRHKNKNGAKDIKKAIHFLNLLLELEYPEEASNASS